MPMTYSSYLKLDELLALPVVFRRARLNVAVAIPLDSQLDLD